MASERCARACPGWDPSQPIGRQGPAHGERRVCAGGSHPCLPLSSGALHLWQSELLSQGQISSLHPLRLSPQSRQQSSPLCSLVSMFQLSAPAHTDGNARPSLGAQDCSPSRLCGLCLSATGQLFPPSPHLGCSTCVCCPVSYGASPDETSARLHLPTRAQVLSHVLSSFSRLFSSYLVTQ